MRRRRDGHRPESIDPAKVLSDVLTKALNILRIGLPIGGHFLPQVGIYLGATLQAATLS